MFQYLLIRIVDEQQQCPTKVIVTVSLLGTNMSYEFVYRLRGADKLSTLLLELRLDLLRFPRIYRLVTALGLAGHSTKDVGVE